MPGRPEEAPSGQAFSASAFTRKLEAEPVAPVPLRSPGGGAGRSGRGAGGGGGAAGAAGASGLRRAVLPAARGLLPDSRPRRSPGRRLPRPDRLGAAGWGAAAGLQGRRGGLWLSLWLSPAAPPGPVRKNLSFSPGCLRAAQCRGSRGRSDSCRLPRRAERLRGFQLGPGCKVREDGAW